MVNKNTIVLVDGQAPPRLIPSTRFTLALLVFFAFIVQYSQRVNLPIAIVCMVNRTKSIHHDLPSNLTRDSNYDLSEKILYSSTTTTTTTTTLRPLNIQQKGGIFDEKKFNWIEFQQQLLLGGYWAGYIFTQVPGGWLATSIGAKWVYAASLGSSSLATLALTLMYFMPNTQFILIFVLRFIIGLAHGVLFPATVALWSLWAVPQERSTLASIGFCGTHLGTSLTMFIGGLFCRYLYSGWMYLFFVSSLLGFIWLVLWVLLTADSPHHHKTISNHERDYISEFTGSTGKKRPMSLASIPWKNIVTSKPVIALMITHIGNLFGLFFFLTNLGKILNEILRLPPQYTGYLLACGFFLTLVSSLLSGIATDHLVRSKTLSLTNARKLSNSLTSFVPVLCMISFCFCDKSHQLLGIVTVLVYLAISGLGYGSGYVVNFADIVPAYSGIVFGVANTFASLAGLIGNIVAGMIIKKPVLEQWRPLYIMFAIVYFISGIVFVCFGSAVPRKWAKFQSNNNSAKDEKAVNNEEKIPMKDKP